MLGTSTFETRGRFRFQDEVTTPDVPEGCPSLSFGYLPPTSIEILPLAILTEASQELITEIAGGPEDLGITIFQTASIITWSTWVSISRAFSELALDMIGRVPFYAVEPSRCPPFTNNTPYERVEEWQRIVPDDLDELEGMIPIEDKLRWIQIRLRRAIELEGRDARAQALVIRIRNLTRLGLPTAAEERERVLTELSAGEAAELLLLQQDRPRLLNLRETLLDARGRGGFAGIVERIDDRWPFIVDWLGCKASWPISQLCWWSLVACGFHQVLSTGLSLLVIFLELIILDGILIQDYISHVPNEIETWGEFYASPVPLTVKLATLSTYIIAFFLFVGFLSEENAIRTLFGGHFVRIVAGRVLLRSMAGRREGQTYAYCTVITFAIISEIHTVIIPAYFPFVSASVLLEHYDGVLFQVSKIYIVVVTIVNTQRFLLNFLQFALCLTVDQANATERFVAGSRARAELNSMSYVYLWLSGITSLTLIALMKWRLAMAYLWFIPIHIVIYATLLLALPYCLHGPRVCAPHIGPCLWMTHLLTTLAFLLFFFVKYGCFLFPCLCAPEIPAWLFFPPSDQYAPPDTLKGSYDVYVFHLAIQKIGELIVDPWAAWGRDCQWEPPESARIINPPPSPS